MREKKRKDNLLKKTIQTAYKQNWALLHVNINSWDGMQNLLQFSTNSYQKSFFLAVTDEIVKFLGGYKMIAQIFQLWKKEYKNKSAYLHLDHSLKGENCQKAIEAGFDSIMFDGSRLSIQENIQESTKIVNLAKKNSVICEIEVGGLENGNSKIEEIIAMLKNVKPDLLAISIGNFHGYKKTSSYIDLNHLKTINQVTKIPLVLHGASGIDHQILKKAQKFGIVKINYDSLFQKIYAQEIFQYLERQLNKDQKWFWWTKIHLFATAKINQKLKTVFQLCNKRNDK